MAQYLDKFSDVIGKRQTQQILGILNKKRNSGQIRSIQEFTSQLEGLMRELTSTTLIPSLKLFMGNEDSPIDSETYNFMLERVQDDLTAAFEEAINIDEVQTSHEAIVRDVILKNLRAGVAELESQITLFEFINTDNRGFDSAIFSTFRESKAGRTQRGGDQTQVLFADPRTGNLVPIVQDATVELVGERLTLANSNNTFHTIVDVRQIFDSTSPQSELIVEPPGVELANIIDNTKGTYWIQSLLFKEKKEFIKVKLEFELSTVREVNVVEIEPASRQGLILEDVSYLDGNNVVTSLAVPEVLIEGPGSVRFKKIATNRIILTFRNENSSRNQFEFDLDEEPLFSQALREPPEGIQPRLSRVTKDLTSIIGSAKVRNIIGLRRKPKRIFDGSEFLTGFDNIRIGRSSYQTRSTYVSVPLKTCGTGELGLRTVETRPYIDKKDLEVRFTNITYDLDKSSALVEDDVFFQGSIEYWVVKQDLSASGSLLRTNTFPILPLGVQRIFHERLVLTEKSIATLTINDLGKLIFFTNATDGDIKVYKNGELLANETGNAFAVTGWKIDPSPNTAGQTPNNGVPMSIRIQVLDLLQGDIVTVSYTPLTSSTIAVPLSLDEFIAIGGLKVVDLVGDLSARLCPGQLIALDRIGEDDESLDSNIFLAIILRQNTAEPTLTPAVEEYTLLAGCKDSTKFEEV